MATTKTAVLDDSTMDATVIGYASNPTEAAEVYMACMKDRMDAEDFAELKRPDFAYRIDGSAVVPSYEPLI